jgi:hypothetical protein
MQRTSRRAKRNPVKGDSTMAALVVSTPFHTIASRPALKIPAPSRPPISACELLEGIPAHHVIKFQEIAPIRDPKITPGSTTSAATIPVPIVCATCTPKSRNAMKLKKAAQMTAVRGRNTRVDTTVAIELALSCSPFKKSNVSATTIRPTRIGRLDIIDIDHLLTNYR